MNDVVENLTFSKETLSNRTLFLSTFNDINVFTVFPLGGKEAVIKKQKESNVYDSNGN